MLLWLIVIAIFAILAVSGYYKGAIRSLVALVGLIIATYLALPLGPYLKSLVPKVGLEHPIWSIVVPPITVFLLIALIFVGLSFLVHQKVALHFKYATDDFTRLKWERLNQRLGLCVGLIGGAIYSILVCLVIYIFGYPAVQVTDENSPTMQRMLSTARQDLSSSGMDKTLSAIDPMPENYYLASDVLGMIYQNYATLQQRLADYPAFLTLGQRSEFKDIATDTTLLNLLQTRGSIVEVLKNPKIVGIINNAEIMGELRQVSLKDLYQYLKTGKSAKYDEEKILGWWQLDPHATFTLARKKNPDMPAKQMAMLKQVLLVWLPQLTLMAAPDNSLMIHFELSDQAKQILEAQKKALEAAQQAQQDQQPGQPGPGRMPPGYAERYFRGQTPPPQAAPQTQPAPTATAGVPGMPELNIAAKGTWQREGSSSRYKLKLQDDKGKESNGSAFIEEDELTMTAAGQTLVFVRTY